VTFDTASLQVHPRSCASVMFIFNASKERPGSLEQLADKLFSAPEILVAPRGTSHGLCGSCVCMTPSLCTTAVG
jgi:hypothetical protein